jgi:hypothetical protein
VINAYKILVGIPHGKNSLGDLEENGRIILKYYIKWGVRNEHWIEIV